MPFRLPRLDATSSVADQTKHVAYVWHVVAIALRLDGICNASEFHLVKNAAAVGRQVQLLQLWDGRCNYGAPRVARPVFLLSKELRSFL